MLLQMLTIKTKLCYLKYENRYIYFPVVFAHQSKNGQSSVGTMENLNRVRAKLVPDENRTILKQWAFIIKTYATEY